MCSRTFETRSPPGLTRCFPRSFAFYVDFPKRSVRPLGLPIYVARVPAGSILARTLVALPSMSRVPGAPLKLARCCSRSFTFYVAPPTRSILLPSYFCLLTSLAAR